ncbi:hypothetical protein Pint_05308 [Pistacia integerrima]|uniref:Uncharacterized protein n=1 Tax=Pistacia integerrima TaxID=434235 RepID=A0ACC0Z587_9ROSI|nr:hypothetical protein Pint_05308 [Pistacia integerrima]
MPLLYDLYSDFSNSVEDKKELLENHCCPIHLKPCVARKEDNYYFALSKYQKPLEETLTRNPDFVQPSFRLNELIGGVPVPNDDKQTIYVWFDALLGLACITALDWQVYWPAMLMSAGLPVTKKVFGHGFLTKHGMKMAKSLGNTLEPNELVHNFGPDAVRYFFLKEVEFGNLLNSTLGLLRKNCKSTLVVDSAIAAEGTAFKDNVEKLVENVRGHYENLTVISL